MKPDKIWRGMSGLWLCAKLNMTKLLLQVSDITTDTTVTYTGQLESALIEVKGLLILKEYHPFL
jgi:hypothetical protein